MSTFREKLTSLINCHSKENGSDTPDFILADYLNRCLATWDVCVKARENWYGRPIGDDKPVIAQTIMQDSSGQLK